MNIPKVSIIVPCYNQAQYLDEALQSVFDQTYQDWECIIVNDGSPDNTETIAQNWCKKDARYTYLYKENGGLSSARNFGIQHAIGTYILPLDADDKIGIDYLALAIHSFQEDSSLKVAYCKAEKFGNEQGLWHLQPFSLQAMAMQNMIFCSAFFRKIDWERVQGYDEKMIYGWEDWEFWIAILKDGGNVKCIDKVGFYYRMKPNSMIQTLDKVKKDMLLNYMSIKHASFFVEQLGSFTRLSAIAEGERAHWHYKLKNKKFVFDVFCTTFFGFSVFGLYKKNNFK
jgi:glycosyltransferase involved in cell wall biosynthesis